MVKLPTRDDLGAMPSARSGRPIATYDTTAVGKGLAQLGRAGQEIAASIYDHARSVEDYEAERRFQEFKWDRELEIEKSSQEIEPGQAGRFAEDWAGGYKAKAKEFLSTVPEAQRGKYDAKLFGIERDLYGAASKFARAEQKRSSVAGIDDFRERYLPQAVTPEAFARFKSDYQSQIDNNPWLSPIEKDELRRKSLPAVEQTRIQFLRDRAQSVEELDALDREIWGGRMPLDTQENPETRARLPARPAGEQMGERPVGGFDAASAAISTRLETGKKNPLDGVSSIARDSAGTKSYGNFGLNSGGSAQKFVAEYGGPLGLTGEPGTAEFDRSWRAAANRDPAALHQAEMSWYSRNITANVSQRLKNVGVDDALAGDPRVQAYFADRSIQQGAGSIDEMAKHRRRIDAAAKAAGGDPVAFLKAVTEADREALTSDFPTALRTGVYSERGHDNRLDGRLKLALGVGEGAPTAEPGEAYSGPYSNLSPEQRLSLSREVRTRRSALEKEREKQLEQEQLRARAQSILSGNEPMDPGSTTDKKIMNSVIEATDIPAGLGEANPAAAGQLTALVKQTGYVPDAAISQLRATAANGTPEQKTFALETAANILREKPGAFEASDAARELRDNATFYEVLTVDAGISSDEALARIAETRSPEFAKRKEAMKKEIAESGQSSVLRDLAPTDLTAEYGGWFTSTPELGGSPRQASLVFDTYRDLVQHHYLNTGDIDAAKGMAKRDIQRTYAETSVTGNKRLMRHPPDAYYPKLEPRAGKEPSLDYFGEQLRATVNDYLRGPVRAQSDLNPETRAPNAAALTAPKEIPLSDIFIEPIPQTNADVRSGRLPGYAVMWLEDRDGIKVMNTAPGMVFRADVKSEQEKQLRNREQRARAMRAKELEAQAKVDRDPARRAGKAVGEFLREGLPSLPNDAGAAERLRGGNREFFDRQTGAGLPVLDEAN